MEMSSRFQSPSLPVSFSPEPAGVGSVTNSSCSLSELDNISHLLRKISTDVNEIKGMKAAILTVEANLFDLNVRVSQNEAKISSLEVKMNEYSASTSECNRQLEDFQAEIDFESQSRGTDVKIIDFLRNTEKGTQQRQLLSRLQIDPVMAETLQSQVEMSELSAAQKPEKLLERCKYWPACKNGDECAFHHPVSPCKAFPNCKFAEKCLFVHPNCKYDAKCTKPDCPFTHINRRIPVLPPKPVTTPASPSTSQLCRYFPACKKMECPFYHPKHCRFNTQCTRPDCTFYHPTITVPPRHALKWIRPQTSE
ncbi:PREDICTED: zinc finger CCCH domain-containing protein 14 isoform X5 [Chinchilla lanigera]|uniref:Zinc finger CCCH domain-containing protein 14 n=1 Tax=Chinchilla lanigera TaxID=34839 RepID=A0A8C2YPY5_CHILA|nr:PREDICTED: zinc finger CCCH domain-containing protein 14 isoform X5 [Chinchilla lanigera]